VQTKKSGRMIVPCGHRNGLLRPTDASVGPDDGRLTTRDRDRVHRAPRIRRQRCVRAVHGIAPTLHAPRTRRTADRARRDRKSASPTSDMHLRTARRVARPATCTCHQTTVHIRPTSRRRRQRIRTAWLRAPPITHCASCTTVQSICRNDPAIAPARPLQTIPTASALHRATKEENPMLTDAAVVRTPQSPLRGQSAR